MYRQKRHFKPHVGGSPHAKTLSNAKLIPGKNSNWSSYARQTQRSFEAEHGHAARFFDNPNVADPQERYWLPEMPAREAEEDDDGEFDEAERITERKAVHKEIRIMKSVRPKIFNDLLDTLSPDSDDLVKRHAEYQIAFEERCPSHLWKIIELTHAIQAENGNAIVKKAYARACYSTLMQGPYESVVLYRQRFDDAYKSYIAAENVPKADEECAMDFFNSLDCNQYKEFLRDIRNKWSCGELDEFDDIQEVYNLVSQYIPTHSVQARHVNRNNAVYHVKEQDNGRRHQKQKPAPRMSVNNSSRPPIQSNAASTRPSSLNNRVRDIDGSGGAKPRAKAIVCYGCGKEGHMRNQCPNNNRVFSTNLSKSHGHEWYHVILDTGAELSIMTSKLLIDVRPLAKSVGITGLTDAEIVVDKTGTLPCFFDVFTSDDVEVNILSMHDVESALDVYYMPNKGFVVVTSCGDIFFKKEGRLYVADMRPFLSRIKVHNHNEQFESHRFDQPRGLPNKYPMLCNEEYDHDNDACSSCAYGPRMDTHAPFMLPVTRIQADDFDGMPDLVDDSDDEDMPSILQYHSSDESDEETQQQDPNLFDVENMCTTMPKDRDGWMPVLDNEFTRSQVHWGWDTIDPSACNEHGKYHSYVVDHPDDAMDAATAFHESHTDNLVSQFDNDDIASRESNALICTISYSVKQLKGAEKAKDLLHRAGYPSYVELQNMVKSGNFTGSTVTASDVAVASDIYGPQVASIRGKYTKRKFNNPPPDQSLIEQSDQVMYLDIMYVSTQPYMVALVTPLFLTLSVPMLNESSMSMISCTSDIMNTIKTKGFTISTIMCEPQSAVAAISTHLGPGVSMNVVGATDHLPILDVKIRRIKEVIRATLVTVNFNVPYSKIKYLVSYAVSRINMRTTSSRGDDQSPSVAFSGVKIRWDREMSLVFGDICECSIPAYVSNNAMQPRTSSHVALCPTGNTAGSWIFWSLSTNSIVRRTHWVKIKNVPNESVQLATQLASKEINSPINWELDKIVDDDVDDTAPLPLPRSHAVDPTIPMDREIRNVGVETEAQAKKTKARESKKPTKVMYGLPHTALSTHIFHPDDVTAPAVNAGNVDTPRVNDVLLTPLFDEPGDDIDEDDVVSSIHELSTSNTDDINSVLHISLKKGLRDYGELADASILSELEQLVVTTGALRPIKRDDYDRIDVKRAIRSHMFLKVKEDAAGNFEKLKSRLVGDGSQQDASLFPNKSSPTAKLESIMTCLALSAKENLHCMAIDITGAYLEADWPTGPGSTKQLIWLEKTMADILIKKFPQYREFVESDGRILLLATKALYGCVESSRLWFELLTKKLKEMGFKSTMIDPCVMYKYINGNRVTIIIYVDDLLVTSCMLDDLTWVLDTLRSSFTKVTGNTGMKDFSYLGMRVRLSTGKAWLTMDAYENNMLALVPDIKTFKYPADVHVFDIRDSSIPLNTTETSDFHTMVAKLLYYSMRVKPQIQVPVSFLCTRVRSPTNDDLMKLLHVLGYIKRTRGKGLMLCIGDKIKLTGWIDAAFGCHHDGKSHTGVVIMIGNACIYSRSVRQKMVTKDSTEAELVGCTDQVCHVMSASEFVTELGYKIPVPELMQDNTSTIHMMTTGSGKDRTRHLRVRKFLMKQKLDAGEVTIHYCPTLDMIADLLSKAKVGKGFDQMCSLVTGVSEVVEEE